MQNILFILKKHIKDIITFSLIIICLSITGYNFYLRGLDSSEHYEEPIISLNNAAPDNESELANLDNNPEIYVDIKGAINTPGVYKVEKNAIVNDVITLAGGFKKDAHTSSINLSKKISDEMVIYVYTKSEIKAHETENITSSEKSENLNSSCITSSYNIYECIDDNASIIEVGDVTTSKGEINNFTPNESLKLININTAELKDLTSLTGIGESKAKAIIAYRTENGAFKSINDIKNVSGIGETVFAKIKDNITV